MTLWRLVIREIAHRRLSFALAVLGVAVACGAVVGQLGLLRVHDAQAESLLAAREAEAQKRLAAMEDDYRKITVAMGFNILILPQGQNVSDFWDKGYAAVTMPEASVRTLAKAGLASLQHVTPILEQKVTWTEQNRTILLMGTRGEEPLMGAGKKPMLAAVAPGKIILGHELWSSLKLKKDDKVTLLGREFTVSRCEPERGSADDITAWVDLGVAQELLGKGGQITAIQALKCYKDNCFETGKAPDLASIRKEVAAVLPGTQVREIANLATAREAARNRASVETAAALEQDRRSQASLRQGRQDMAAALVPLAILVAALWTGVLALVNVRQRSVEIGILRAIGLRSGQVFRVFVAKAAVVAAIGAMVGLAGGLSVAIFAAVRGSMAAATALSWPTIAATAAGAVVVCCLASWAPATLAARQDPAAILAKE